MPGQNPSRGLLSRVLPVLLVVSSAAVAQDPPLHVSERGTFSQASSVYADVWGEGDYAYVARYGQAAVDIVDVSNPDNPTLVATYQVPAPADDGSAQDVKVHDGIMYIGMESESSNAVVIVDVRVPANPTLLTRVDVGSSLNSTHNVFVDAGWLYIVNSSTTDVGIVDLRSYDPDNAPANITSLAWLVTDVGDTFVHDITVSNGRLYCAAWDSLVVYDVSNLGSQAPQLIGSAPGVSCHATWPTADGAWVVTGEERTGGGLELYEVIENGGTIELELADTFSLPPAEVTSAHNQFIVGDVLYSSYYHAGLQVLAIDRATRSLQLMASFDTSHETPPPPGAPPPPHEGSLYAGNWGVYPLLGDERILVSDIEEGLFVLEIDALAFLGLEPPLTVDLASTSSVDVSILSVGAAVDPSSVQLVTSLDGGPAAVTPMVDLGGGDFSAELPTSNCGELTWYVRADNLDASSFTYPLDAPGESFTTLVVTNVTSVFADDFEADLGWTVASQSLSTGAWTRVEPLGTGAQPGIDNPTGTGTRCFVTGQGVPGGIPSDNDLDGGPTVLTSPAFDLSGSDGTISYASWLFNNTDDDELLVEVSNNGVGWTTVTSRTGGNGGWKHDAFRVSDFVAPTSQVRVRFSVADEPNDSLTEAAIDDVVVQAFDCLEGVWDDLGGGTVGAAGVPLLVMSGPQTPGSLVTADLSQADSSAILLLWISLGSSPLSIFGGTLHAFPFSEEFLLFADGAGTFNASAPWAGGVPPGTQAWWQFLCEDGINPYGLTLSNGVRSTSP